VVQKQEPEVVVEIMNAGAANNGAQTEEL